MHLARLRLRDFRNYARLDLDFTPGFHLLLGNNGQGKTNILEAIYLLATLRSFRGVGSAQMIRHGAKGYFVGAKIIGQGENTVKIYWSAQERKIDLNNQPVRRITDYLGVFRAVVFCTEDLQLVKGPASRRRRFLDLLLSQTHPTYLPLLQRYAQALRARNALLKQPAPNEASLESFTRELVDLGNQLMQFRRALLPRIAPLAQSAYQRLAPAAEAFTLEYQPAVKKDFAVELAQSRARELALRATLLGPHRDELRLLLDNRSAAQFASEGQKRSIVIALKIAQAEYLTDLHGAPPTLLIDDIMGELDLHRRRAFLPLLQEADRARSQVFMTVTEENWPREIERNISKWTVHSGQVQPLQSS